MESVFTDIFFTEQIADPICSDISGMTQDSSYSYPRQGISPLDRQRLEKLTRQMGPDAPIRWGKVCKLRHEIETGQFENDERIQGTIDRLAQELSR
jgi:hypothetical protein